MMPSHNESNLSMLSHKTRKEVSKRLSVMENLLLLLFL